MNKQIENAVFKLCLKNMHHSPSIINDQFYGTISCGPNNSFPNKIHVLREDDKKCENPIIIVVLESPHIDEFLPCNLHPLHKDEKFKQHFHKALSNCAWKQNIKLKQGDYDVYFMNAIQLQCSLGFDTEFYRDVVFMTLWEHFHKDFENRLNNQITKNNVSLIVNLVTKGSHKKMSSTKCPLLSPLPKNFRKFLKSISSSFARYRSLQEVVAASINNVKTNNIIYVEGNHPSYRHWGKNPNFVQK